MKIESKKYNKSKQQNNNILRRFEVSKLKSGVHETCKILTIFN